MFTLRAKKSGKVKLKLIKLVFVFDSSASMGRERLNGRSEVSPNLCEIYSSLENEQCYSLVFESFRKIEYTPFIFLYSQKYSHQKSSVFHSLLVLERVFWSSDFQKSLEGAIQLSLERLGDFLQSSGFQKPIGRFIKHSSDRLGDLLLQIFYSGLKFDFKESIRRSFFIRRSTRVIHYLLVWENVFQSC